MSCAYLVLEGSGKTWKREKMKEQIQKQKGLKHNSSLGFKNTVKDSYSFNSFSVVQPHNEQFGKLGTLR